MLRFVVGELAIGVVTLHPEHEGLVVEVIGVGPYAIGDFIERNGTRHIAALDSDYFVDAGGKVKLAKDYQLRKIEPPAESTEMTKHEEQTA